MTDRELDARVAVEVMGWESDKFDLHFWHPSTDIAAAWEVWEHMKADEERWRRFIEALLTQMIQAFYTRQFPVRELYECLVIHDIERVFSVITPTAICLASLEAVKEHPHVIRSHH